jgi:hypothetical protein
MNEWETGVLTQYPTDPAQALIMALRLAITAPDDDKARQCAEIAEWLAADMTPEQVERAQSIALDFDGKHC